MIWLTYLWITDLDCGWRHQDYKQDPSWKATAVVLAGEGGGLDQGGNGRDDGKWLIGGVFWISTTGILHEMALWWEEKGRDWDVKSESVSHSVMADSLGPQGLQPARLLCPLEFSRQEYWSGLPFLPLGDLPDPGTEPGSLALQTDSLPSESWGKKPPYLILYVENTKYFSKNMRTNTLSKVVEETSVYKNPMHFFTLTTNCYKRNWEKNSIYICMKMNKMSRDKFNQGSERPVHWKL